MCDYNYQLKTATIVESQGQNRSVCDKRYRYREKDIERVHSGAQGKQKDLGHTHTLRFLHFLALVSTAASLIFF